MNYRYKAIDESGLITTGQLDANNERDLESRLTRMKLDLISFKTIKPIFSLRFTQKITRHDLISFYYTLLQQYLANIPIIDSLSDARDTTENNTLVKVISNMMENIYTGDNLSQAMSKQKIFDPVSINIIKAGEQSSSLDKALEQLIDSLKWQDELLQQTKRMLFYPAMVFMLLIFVFIFLFIYLLPKLENFYAAFDLQLPWHTRIVLESWNFIVQNWFSISPIIVLIAMFGAYLLHKKRFKYFWDKQLISGIYIGAIIKKYNLSRIANVFSVMYDRGIPIFDCLNSCAQITANSYISHSIQRAIHQMEQGNSLSESFENIGIFPKLVIRMLKVGESTGQLGNALENVSHFYTREVRNSVDKLILMMVPLSVLFLAMIFLWIAFSMFLPIFEIMSTANL